ncbi:hypothetical protein [Larkinella punicea]|nr:hypothetical protein [Larkinella punicea]
MRTSILILLLMTLGLPFWGTYTLLQSQKYRVRKDVENRLEEGRTESQRVTLKLAVSEIKTNLRWEHDREFEYQGQMYDLIATTVVGDSVFYECWWDKEETRLNRQLASLEALEKDAQQEEESTEASPFLQPLFCQELLSWISLPTNWFPEPRVGGFINQFALYVALTPPQLPPERSFHIMYV